MAKKVIIVAGEASGDFHAASLIHALKNIHPDIEISGIGGEKMRAAGAKLYFDISELAIIGFTGVIKNFRKIQQVFNTLLEVIRSEAPDFCLLVDYPGFNLKLAKEIKKSGIPVIYYISPQIWAWWKGRIKTIKQYVDRMIVIFKFEEDLYRQHGIDVDFVGHPLLDIAHPTISRSELLNKLGLAAQRQTIGLAPGSRKIEVERILPVLLESARLINQKLPQTQFVVLKAPQLAQEAFTPSLKKYNLPLALCAQQTYDFLNACDFVLVASGTATLETAIMQKPMIVVYKVSFLNWLIAKFLIRLPFIGLVNVVAQRKIVPEFIQYQARPKLIAQEVQDILSNETKLTNVRSELKRVRESLGSAGASQRAAEIICRLHFPTRRFT